MQKTIKTTLFLIGFAILLCLQPTNAETNELTKIRAWEYKSYLRIVFDFEKTVKYNQPVIIGKDRFSIDFYNVSTTLPDNIESNLIDKIEFVYQATFLTAYVNLPVKQFTIKSFSLLNPFRVVCDIYKMPVNLIEKSTKKPAKKENDTPLIEPEPQAKLIIQEHEVKPATEITADIKQPFEANTATLINDELDDKGKENKKSSDTAPEKDYGLDLKKLFDTKDNANSTDKSTQPLEIIAAPGKTYPDKIEQELKHLSEKIIILEQTISKNSRIEDKNTEEINQLKNAFLQKNADKPSVKLLLVIVLSVFAVIIILLLFLILFTKRNRNKSIDLPQKQETSFKKNTNPFSFDKKIKTEFQRIKEEFDEQKKPEN